MTVPRNVPALQAPSLTSALGALRMRGMRVSAARRQVLEALYAADGPVSPETLAARVPGSDLASIYRNLDVLEELGLVRHMHLGHGPGLYSLASTRDVEFVTCERCGSFEALDTRRLDAVRAAIEAECGYVARFTHFPIVGVCPACQSAPNQEASHHAHP
jgi:Fur family ferric uptake transcriptional regulator